MRILSVIQPSELGPDFSLENGVWKVNFPVVVSDGSELSSDVNNALTQGTDTGLFLSSDLLNAYAMVQDNVSQKINLYRFPAGSVFSVETATLVSSVNLIDMTGIFDDVAINGEVITFTDAENGVTLTLDTANLQRVASILGSNTVEVMSLNGTTTISAKIDPNPNNAIQVTEAGLFVPDNSGNVVGELQQTLAVVETGLCHAVGDSHLVMPQIELVDVAGNSIGYLTDMANLPASSITADGSHCTNWQPPMANNCRIGKVGVGFANDFLYDVSIDDGEVILNVPLAWRVLINGVDTNYLAYSDLIDKLLTDYPTVNPELVMGVGYLEDILVDASNGEIDGVWESALTVWNKTDKQNVITLIPLRPLTLEDFVDPFDELKPVLDIREFDQATLDEMVATNFMNVYSEYPHTLTTWANYFNASYVHNGEVTGAVSICLAPNASVKSWDVTYFDTATNAWVELKTGPVVTRESIDPTVDFSNVDSASYIAWYESLASRTQLFINSSVNVVSTDAFGMWYNLSLIEVNAHTIETNAFPGEVAIGDLTIGPNVRDVWPSAFSYINIMNSLTIEEGVTYLHNSAFAGSRFDGGTLIIPDSVTSYGQSITGEVQHTGLTAFSGIANLIIGGGCPISNADDWGGTLGDSITRLEFRPGVASILGSWSAAAPNCAELILPQGLVSIGDEVSNYTFGDFNALTELTIPGTVQFISESCFQSMKSLESLTIERGVGTISAFAFQNFGSNYNNEPHPLKEFNFLGGTIIGESAFQNWYLADPNFEIVIPDTVTEIRESAFQNHEVTKSLRFAEGCMAVVSTNAFLSWFKATDLHISDSVDEINASFLNWNRGQNLYIGSGIKSLGGVGLDAEFINWGSDYVNESYPDLAHLGSNKIIIPDSVETIHAAFGGNSKIDTLIVSAGLITLGNIDSPYIKNLFLRCPTAPTIIENSRLLSGVPGQVVYVAILTGYETVVNDTFALFIPPLDATDVHEAAPIVVQEGDWDVQYLDLATGTVHTAIGEIRDIVDNGFAAGGVKGLIDDIVINGNVTHIGEAAFAGNTSIKRIHFVGNSLKSIGPSAFAGATVHAKELHLPLSLERIGSGAVSPTGNMNKFSFGSNLISVASDAVESSDKFATPSKLLPPAPVFVNHTATTITGQAMVGDTVICGITQGEITVNPSEVVVGLDGSFAIDLAAQEVPTTLQSGDKVSLQIRDVVGNTSSISYVVFL